MRPSRDELMLRTASLWALRSTCSRAQVGCVIAREARIIVQGYNGAPAGMPHCVHTKDEPCDIAVHAEANAIAYAARFGVRLDETTLYCTRATCPNCARLIINAGIKRVVYFEDHRDMSGLELLRLGMVSVTRYDMMEA